MSLERGHEKQTHFIAHLTRVWELTLNLTCQRKIWSKYIKVNQGKIYEWVSSSQTPGEKISQM